MQTIRSVNAVDSFHVISYLCLLAQASEKANKAAVLYKVNDMRISDWPMPGEPGPDDVIIEVCLHSKFVKAHYSSSNSAQLSSATKALSRK